jgi:5-formyltetrahydrofolate cyclo-ligase
VSSIAEQKDALRRSLRLEAKCHLPEERQKCSAELCSQIKAQSIWQQAHSILFYMPLIGEPDLTGLMAEAIAAGKTVALPQYSEAKQRYHACQISNPAEHLRPGAYGIREPASECPVHDLNKLDFLLIPGVGFSFTGRRLGRGKGHYDRLLAEATGRKCGVAFDWQVTDEIPVEDHDIFLDCIVTPTHWQDVSG